MAGLTGQSNAPRRLAADVLIAAWEGGWEGGWDDGHEQFELHKRYSA